MVLVESPTECAKQVAAELMAILDCQDPGKFAQCAKLLRQIIRYNFEQAAVIAETWVLEHDLYEDKSGMAVGDAIAEEIRQLVDERRSKGR